MDARADRRLGHDQELRLLEEFADLRRHRHELIAAAQKPHVGRAQKPESGFEFRHQLGVGVRVGVVAGAEQREIVGGDPLQELDRFGDLVGGKRRRIGFELGGDFAGARQHRPPILHRDPHIGQHLFERAHDIGALFLIVRVGHMNVDEAFAVAVAFARALEGDEPAGLVALDAENRMYQQPDVHRRARRARPAPSRPGTACRR